MARVHGLLLAGLLAGSLPVAAAVAVAVHARHAGRDRTGGGRRRPGGRRSA